MRIDKHLLCEMDSIALDVAYGRADAETVKLAKALVFAFPDKFKGMEFHLIYVVSGWVIGPEYLARKDGFVRRFLKDYIADRKEAEIVNPYEKMEVI